jgi:hypothetical protein
VRFLPREKFSQLLEMGENCAEARKCLRGVARDWRPFQKQNNYDYPNSQRHEKTTTALEELPETRGSNEGKKKKRRRRGAAHAETRSLS